MAFEAGAIIGDLELRTSNFDARIKHAEKEALDAEKKMDEAFEEVRNSLENALGQMIGQMGDGLGLAAKGAVDSIQGISEAIDAIDSENPKELIQGCKQALEGLMELAEGFAEVVEHIAHAFHEVELAAIKTGTSTEFMSHLEAQANAAGTSLDTVVAGMKILEQRAELAGEGNQEAAKGFERLGISAQEAGQLAGNSQELWDRVQGSLSGMTDAAERTTAALGVMGRQGFNLVPILAQSSEELQRMAEFSDAVGATVTASDAEMGKSFSELGEEFSLTISGLENAAARPILQALQEHSGELRDVFLDIGAVGNATIVPLFQNIGIVIGDVISTVHALIQEMRELVDIVTHPITFLEDPNAFMQNERAKFQSEGEALAKQNVHVTVKHDSADSGRQLGDRIINEVRRGARQQQSEFQAAAMQRVVEGNVAGGSF